MKEKLWERWREKAISHMAGQEESVDFKGLEITHTLICTLDKQEGSGLVWSAACDSSEAETVWRAHRLHVT